MNNGELHGKELLFGWTQYNAEEQQQLRSLLSQASYGRLLYNVEEKRNNTERNVALFAK
jgi:16S rRNA G1207 methylase RsmC